jgi:hypothetical protein
VWQLSFFVAPDGSLDPPSRSWCISLSLLETSPPIDIDSYLFISEVKVPQLPNSPNPKWISIGLKGKLEAARDFFHQGGKIVVALDGSLAGPGVSLRQGWAEYSLFSMSFSDTFLFRNSPYISADGKLRARFEVR